LFRDDERGMIGEHDAAGADANCFCAACDVTNDDRGGGAGDSRHVVMLGEPVAVETQGFGVLREVERIAESVGGRGSLGYGREV